MYLQKYNDEWKLIWDSNKKTLLERSLFINECQLILGMNYGNFLKKKKYTSLYTSNLCVSFLAPQRTFDVVFLNENDMKLWLKILPRAGILKINDPNAKNGRKSMKMNGEKIEIEKNEKNDKMDKNDKKDKKDKSDKNDKTEKTKSEKSEKIEKSRNEKSRNTKPDKEEKSKKSRRRSISDDDNSDIDVRDL
jgi:hypothetical protein